MNRLFRLVVIALLIVVQCQIASAQPAAPTTQISRAPLNPALPTLFVVGDSTASTGLRSGWGDPLADYFDSARINVRNRALGGRSSRSFISEGYWAKLLNELKPGDYVVIQWGQNDGGSLDTQRARGSLPGIGEETREVLMPTTGPIEPPPPGRREVVHTFGWYLRKYIADTRAKGATPILMSLTAKNIFDNGKNRHPYDKYPEWTKAVAEAEKALYMDYNNMMGEAYDKLGAEKVKAFFSRPADTTHTSDAGADFNAQGVVAGLKAMKSPLVEFLNEKGKAVAEYRKE